ncbi:MAG: Arylsulfatase [Verrucomicrobiota bacterium]|jgi:arylsulfatase A-like enzyme
MNLPIRRLLTVFTLALTALLAAPTAVAADSPRTPPNVLYILADDLGVGDLSCFNPQSAWRTPHLDRLAREGMMFTDAHSASGVCTPSRYTLLTGRYSWRTKMKKGVLNGYSPPLLEPGRVTVADFLRGHGYATAAFGKWHLGLGWQRTGPREDNVDFAQLITDGPTHHGFDRFFGISASLDMPPYVWIADDRATRVPTATVADSPAPKLWRGGPIADDFKMEDVQPRLTEQTLAYLAERAAARDGKPFFLYVPLAAPHTPVLPTRDFDGKTGTTPYGDFVAQVDADVGRILAALDAHGLAKNTLVIFTADNGFAPPGGLAALQKISHDPSAGHRGYKADLFEGGHRVPFLARWPGVTPAGTRCAETIGQLDLFATCAEILGAKIPATAAEDSVSFLPLLRGAKSSTPRAAPLVNHSADGEFAIRDGKWKLLLCPGSGGWSAPTATPSVWLPAPRADLSKLPPFQLYDLATDPAETKNLAATHPEIVQRLGRALRDLIERGRSTPGAPQPVVLDAGWPQLAWMKNFAP